MVTSALPAVSEPASVRRPARRYPWQSPDGQPAYARPALLGIAAFAGVLYLWGVDRSGYHVFYADSVRSMTLSWKAFVFGSFDPANTITLDKLPGFLWPQALSARLLGFHPWSLALPQAVEGVLSVLVLFRAVRQWAGADAALLAATAFAVTPVLAGLFRTSVEDPVFTLLLLLAAEAAHRAARTARLRPLLLAAVWVGLAFQAKMLEAWAVLPALAAVHLLAAPVRLRRRLGQVALAGLVTVAVSASWMAVATLTPAQARPYVDGTTDNSVYSMVVGYNFLNRFSSVGLSAERTGSVTADRSGTPPMGPAGAAEAGVPTQADPAHRSGQRGDGGWTKMLRSRFASQTGWLYPLAAVSLLCALAWRRREPRTDLLRAGYVLWGGWLAVFFLAFSAGSIGPHTYYMGVIATALAALSGAGVVLLRQGFREGGLRAWALPAAVAGTVGWGVWLSRRFPDFLPWLAPAAVATGVVALALLGAGKLFAAGRPAPVRITALGVAAGIAASLLTPAAWAVSVLKPKYANSGFGTVGPAAAHTLGLPSGTAGLTPSQQALLDYVRSHGDGARYLFAASRWTLSSPYILTAGAKVLPMGGFTGEVPSPTLGQVRELVGSSQLRYVLLGPGKEGRATTEVTSWVRANCALVQPARYGQPATATAEQTLYHCLP